jgi:hypothetical protein
MVVVDAANGRAAIFYEAHSFIHLPDSLRLIIPMRVVEKLKP